MAGRILTAFLALLPPWLAPALARAEEAAANAPPIDLLEETLRIMGYLALLIVLAVLAVKVGKRLEPRIGGGPVRLLGGRNLGPGVGVRLVRVGSRAWLIGVTKERVSLLAELGEQELQALEEQTR
ncbi:MAG: flagellar biosynthetic protein FliO [Magnetococcales bacterium]|nr:flagellar biosynthetic protein FliO [Magnetococcales bacterium]